MNAGRLSFAKKSLLQATDHRSATNTWNQFHLIQEIFPGRLGTPPSVGGRQGARNPPEKILIKTWSEQSVTSEQKQTPCWKMDCPPSCSQPPFSGIHSIHQIYPPENRETTAFSVQKMSIFRNTLKIPHLKIAHLGGNLEVGNIDIQGYQDCPPQ